MRKYVMARIASVVLGATIVPASLAEPLYAQIFAQSALAENRQNIDVEKAGDITAASEATQGFENIVVQPVTPEQAALQVATSAALARPVPEELALRTGGGSAAPGVASFADMAHALKNDPDLIYEYVRNNVEFIPIYGIKKGPLGALIDGQGTAADQAELMVKLLQSAGLANASITNPRVIQGVIDLDRSRLRSYLGINTSTDCDMAGYANRIFTAGGVPKTLVGPTACLTNIYVTHFWVRVTLSGVNYDFDPSFKSYDYTPNIDLLGATGFDLNPFLNSARDLAVITPDYVQNINRSNVRANLNSYTTNLINWIRTNKPSADINDIIGGKVIRPTYDTVRNLSLPYLRSGAVPVDIGPRVPNTLRPTLRVRFKKSAEATFPIDRTFFSDDLAGKRLTLFFNNGVPTLSLDGVAQQTGTVAYNVLKDFTEISFDVIEPVAAARDVFKQTLRADGSYLISNSWGPSGRGPIDVYQRSLQAAIAAGQADTSEAKLGSSLGVLAQNWISQSDFMFYLLDQLAGARTQIHHHVGIAGQSASGPYVDLPGNKVTVVAETANPFDGPAIASALFFTAAGHTSIFESTAVQQVAEVSAVSTVKLIDIASANGYRIYSARSSNYAAISPLLVNCTASSKNTFLAATNAGRRLILPDHCDLTEDRWRGVGYYDITATGTGIGAIIGGGLFGGFSSKFQPPAAFNAGAIRNTIRPINFIKSTGSAFGDPIDMFKGAYLYSRDDIKVGEGAFPYSLGFQRLYATGARIERSSLGNGWTHNFASTARVSADGFQALGEDSAIDGAATIVELLVSLNLLVDTTKPLDRIVMATLAQRWFSDQLLENTVIVSQGQNAEVFVKLPDGSYNPPPGSTARLTRNGDATFRYETLDKAVMNFNAAGNLQNWIHPTGVLINLAYNGNNLTQVSNNLGRALNFGYNGSNLSSISDGNGRSVFYNVDAGGNLISSTDSLFQQTIFEYDLPGRLTKLFYPTAPTSPFLFNVYDSFDRVHDVTPNFHPVAIRASALLLPMCAGEARGCVA